MLGQANELATPSIALVPQRHDIERYAEALEQAGSLLSGNWLAGAGLKR